MSSGLIMFARDIMRARMFNDVQLPLQSVARDVNRAIEIAEVAQLSRNWLTVSRESTMQPALLGNDTCDQQRPHQCFRCAATYPEW